MSADHRKIELARQMLEELGVPYGAVRLPQPMPTVAAYLPRMIAAATQSQMDNYARYWRCAVEMFSDRELDAVLPSDILALQRQVTQTARPRGGRRNGRHAGEHCIRAMRTLSVDVGGRGVTNHAGTAALRLIADRAGLTEGLSRALVRRGFTPVHDRAQPTQTHHPHSRNLALGQPARHLPKRRPRPAPTSPLLINESPWPPTETPTRTRGTRRPPGATAGHPTTTAA